MAGVNASQRASSLFRAASKTIVREWEITRQSRDERRKGESLHFTLTPLFVWRSCVWKRIHFDAFRPSVQTNTMSVFVVNASIWKRSRKWIKTKTHSYRDRICVDGRIRIKMKTMTKISQAHVFVACAWSSADVTTCNFIVFERFSVGSQKRIKTVVWTRIDRRVFLWQRKTHTFENVFVCRHGLSISTTLKWKACSQG